MCSYIKNSLRAYTEEAAKKIKKEAPIMIILQVLGTYQGEIIFSLASSKLIGELLNLKVNVVTKVGAVVLGDV